MDEALDDILLVSPHNHAADARVVRLGPEVPRVGRISAVLKRNEVVFLVAGHVVGMRHAEGGIDLPCPWVDDLRPRLMDGVPRIPEAASSSACPVYSAGGRISFVLQRGLQMLSWMFRWVTCGFAAPGVLTGSG